MNWNEFKSIFLEEIQTNLKDYFINLMKNSYVLMKNRSYGVVEFSLINILSKSNKWVVRQRESNDKASNETDVVIVYNGNEFPLSIKTSLSMKNGIQLLNSTKKMKEIFEEYKDNRFEKLSGVNALNTPILILEFKNGEMLFNIKEPKYINFYDQAKKVNKFGTLTIENEMQRSLLTLRPSKATILAYESFFDTTTLLKTDCPSINMILYNIFELMISNDDSAKESFQNDNELC